MDRQLKLKAILDEFMPYTEDESQYGAASAAKRQAKYELRQRLAHAIETYSEFKDVPMPGLNIDMVEVIKKYTEEN